MTCRFVAKQQLRALRERSRNRHALRLTPRELSRKVIELRRQSDQLQQRGRSEGWVRAVGVDARRERDILESGEVRQQVPALEHVGDSVCS